ncbi:MAG: hypothetical protein LBF40_02580 [Deltaproteobacteria bacterium]|jgi:hypothetical protein|nr:hypothetical protein [Deltaproteobacteria bacterium]
MPLRKTLPLVIAFLGLFLAGCGDTNPLIGSWHLDAKDASIYVRLGISLATSGQNLTVVFDEQEMKVNYGRGVEAMKVTYVYNKGDKTWSFCLNDSSNCFPAIFTDEKKSHVTFPVYGVYMSFIRQNG